MKHWEHHPEPVEGCFGCKALTLEMNAGDATRDISDKKWTAELRAYKDARAQGIQPNSTHMPDIRRAHEASEILGRPYNGDTMPKAHKITKKTVEVMKEIGA
jgi:hypothetical protein